MIPLPLQQRGGILPWLLGGGLVVGAVVVGGAAGFWLLLNLRLGLTISEQPLALGLPDELEVETEVTNVLDIGMKGLINAQVPFDREVVVPMRGEYDLDVSLDADVPLDFDITYNGLLPVDTYADITARTDLDFRTIKQYRNIEIKARLPLKLNIPVDLKVPVRETIRFRYDGPLTVVANQNLNTRLETVLSTTLAVDQVVSTPVTRSFGLKLQLPDDQVKAIINHSDLKLDPSTLRLEIADDNDGPERMDSPFGPAAD